MVTMVQELSKLVALDPREVWPNEAHDYTPWLLANADALATVLGIDIELTTNEHPVGGFALDLLGTDLTNDCVLVVENQLSTTDHTHLGQIVTYSAGTDAKTIVWMATAFREEHRQALDWLNAVSEGNARFFGVEIGAVRIANSPPAPLFTLRAQPNDWHSQTALAARATTRTSGKGDLYIGFWTRFLERVHKEHPDWTHAKKPGASNWFTMSCPLKGGPAFSVSFAANGKLRSELYIDYEANPEQVAKVFAFLSRAREYLETQYGGSLSWEELPNNRASRIADYSPGDVTNIEQHDEYIDWFFDTSSRLRKALSEPFDAFLSQPTSDTSLLPPRFDEE